MTKRSQDEIIRAQGARIRRMRTHLKGLEKSRALAAASCEILVTDTMNLRAENKRLRECYTRRDWGKIYKCECPKPTSWFDFVFVAAISMMVGWMMGYYVK